MAVSQQDCKLSRKSEGDVGGTTYYVMVLGSHIVKALCYRKIHKQDGMRCSNPAGFRTDHFGTGACFLHGGANTANVTITNGRQARSLRTDLKDKVDRYLNTDRADLLDLTYQLATARAVYDELIETMPAPDQDDYGVTLYRFLNVLNSLASLVERMAKVENRNSITMAQVLYIRATVVDMFVKYIPDPMLRERAARELAKRLGGDVEVEMLPSEFNRG